MTTTRDTWIVEAVFDDEVSNPAARANASVGRLDDSFNQLKRGASGLSPRLGGIVNDLEDLIVALGPAGAAVGATAAVGLLATSLARATVEAAEHSDELRELGLISDQTAESLKSSAVTIEAQGKAFEAAKAQIISFYADGLQGFIRWTSVAAMAWDDFIHGRGFAGLEEYVRRWVVVEEAVKAAGEQTQSQIPAFEKMRSVLEANAQATAELSLVDLKGSDAIERRLELVREATIREQEAWKERQRIMDEEGAGLAAYELAFTETHTRLTQLAIEDARLTAQLEAVKRAEREKTLNQALYTINTLIDAATTGAGDLIAVQKVLSAVEIALNSAVAGWRLFAEGGFWGIAAAIATWAAGAVSVGWALSQAFTAPSKHPIPSIGGRGGNGAISGINFAGQGNAGGGGRRSRQSGDNSPVVVNQWRHRIYDDVTSDALRRDSPLSKAIAGSPHRSH